MAMLSLGALSGAVASQGTRLRRHVRDRTREANESDIDIRILVTMYLGT